MALRRPAFEDRYRTVRFDYVGAGGSDLSAYDPERYGTLHGYALDVLDVCEALDLHDAVFVGHSVSSMIGVLAAAEARGRIGALVLVGPSPRCIDDDGYVGGFTAADIDELLQSTFLPPELLSVPGVDVGGAYRPAGDGSEVGGDFYDVFETGRGSWAVVLGDVCGKGAGAAVVTALARYTVRAEALRTPYPSAVLAGLHDALVAAHPDRFCTAVLLVLQPTPDGVRCTVACGGHQLPLRRAADGAVTELGETGTILGMLDTPRLFDTATALQPGDVVVLFTDGVPEARRHGELYDDARLRAVVDASAHAGAQEIADRLVGDVLEFQDGVAGDDIAVVVLRVPS